MSVTLNDITLQTNDLLSNYNVTTVDAGNTMRAINRAIEYVQRRLGLPSDKKIFPFLYYADIKFYTMPSGFNELIQLYYNDDSVSVTDHNFSKNRWFAAKDIELLRSTGPVANTNRVAFTTINGANQLLLVGSNLNGSSLVNAFDSISGIVFSSNVSGQVIDNNIKQQGSGSLKFNINNTLSSTTITLPGNWDISNLLNIFTAYRLFVDFPIGAAAQFSSVQISFVSSTGNSYNISTSLQDNGTAWTENIWNRLSFALANATTVGSPLSNGITSIVITLVHSGSFTGVTNMRLDNFYQVNPDYLNALYYSAYKGTDSTGTVQKINLTDDSDIVSFGDYAQDLIYPISLKAATILNPQLRADKDFANMYQADFKDVITLMSRTYPRIRQAGSAQTQLIR